MWAFLYIEGGEFNQNGDDSGSDFPVDLKNGHREKYGRRRWICLMFFSQ